MAGYLYARSYVSGQPAETTAAGGGDVTAADNFGTDTKVIVADGTGKGVKSSPVKISTSGAVTAAASYATSRRSDQGDQLDMYEASGNGNNKISVKAPDSIASDATLTWGTTTGTLITGAEINTYAELNAIVADATLTHNGLIDTISELDAIVADANIITEEEMDASAELAALMDDETGTGSVVFANTPTLVTPVIGAATGTSLTLTGNIIGEIPITLDTDAAVDLSAATATRGHLRINNDADAIDYTLPPCEAGLSVCFYDIAGGVITVDPDDGTDTIYLDGSSVGAGDAIDSPGAAGDYICLVGVDADRWITMGRSGTWVDGGAD